VKNIFPVVLCLFCPDTFIGTGLGLCNWLEKNFNKHIYASHQHQLQFMQYKRFRMDRSRDRHVHDLVGLHLSKPELERTTEQKLQNYNYRQENQRQAEEVAIGR
jgi:hypothetical protein